MLLAQLAEVWFNPEIAVVDKFSVFIVKIPCALTLHFVLYPEIIKGMNLMKFANNEIHLFVEEWYGS